MRAYQLLLSVKESLDHEHFYELNEHIKSIDSIVLSHKP